MDFFFIKNFRKRFCRFRSIWICDLIQCFIWCTRCQFVLFMLNLVISVCVLNFCFGRLQLSHSVRYIKYCLRHSRRGCAEKRGMLLWGQLPILRCLMLLCMFRRLKLLVSFCWYSLRPDILYHHLPGFSVFDDNCWYNLSIILIWVFAGRWWIFAFQQYRDFVSSKWRV